MMVIRPESNFIYLQSWFCCCYKYKKPHTETNNKIKYPKPNIGTQRNEEVLKKEFGANKVLSRTGTLVKNKLLKGKYNQAILVFS